MCCWDNNSPIRHVSTTNKGEHCSNSVLRFNNDDRNTIPRHWILSYVFVCKQNITFKYFKYEFRRWYALYLSIMKKYKFLTTFIHFYLFNYVLIFKSNHLIPVQLRNQRSPTSNNITIGLRTTIQGKFLNSGSWNGDIVIY